MRCLVAGLVMLASQAACSDPPLNCVQNLSTSCAALYPPTFDNVFTDTLIPKCSTGGGSCHTPEGHQAGLSFDPNNENDAYAQLLMASTTFPDRQRVAPGDISCSEMIERIYSTADRWHMPRGSALGPEEECSIVQWVAEGAERSPPDAAPPPPDAGLPDAPLARAPRSSSRCSPRRAAATATSRPRS
jgi:hypothetical protein